MTNQAQGRTTVIVALLAMIGPLAIDTIFPAFARIGVQFAESDAALQQLTSVYLLSFALASLFHGPISDAVGRKPVMAIGIGAFGLASIACALAPNFSVLVAMRALQGASAGAGQIISRALIRDIYAGAQAQRVMAQVAMIFAVAPAFAPVLGGWLLQVGNWPVIFYFLAAYAALLVVLIILGLPETHPTEARTPLRIGPLLGGLAAVASQGRFVRLAFAASFGFAGLFLYVVGAPIFVVRLLGLGEDQFWVVFFPVIGGMVLGSFLNSRLAARGHPVRLASVGYLIAASGAIVNVALAVLPATTSLPWVLIGPSIISFGTMLSFPITQLQMLDLFPHRRGSAASMQAFVQLVLNAALAGVVVPLVATSPASMAITSLGFVAVGSALWTWHVASARRTS